MSTFKDDNKYIKVPFELKAGMYITRDKEIMQIDKVNEDGTVEGTTLRQMSKDYRIFPNDTWNPKERPFWVPPTYGYRPPYIGLATPHQVSIYEAFKDQYQYRNQNSIKKEKGETLL
jgi:hypothetical protein